MDKNFRRQMERQIDLLQRRKLCREIRMTGVVPLPKNGFRHWSDNGREWRESVLQSSALERLLIVKEDRPSIPSSGRKTEKLLRRQGDHQLSLLRFEFRTR